VFFSLLCITIGDVISLDTEQQVPAPYIIYTFIETKITILQQTEAMLTAWNFSFPVFSRI